MAHKLVEQLRNARREWLRGLEGVNGEEACRRFEPLNSIGWMIGHLAGFEQRIWVEAAQGKIMAEAVQACGFGKPASTPPLDEMLAAAAEIADAADEFLETLTEADMGSYLTIDGKPLWECNGDMLMRQTWHYWYHLGECQSVRQLLGHTNLPAYVGDIDEAARYTPNVASNNSDSDNNTPMNRAKALVDRMVNGLNDHEIHGMEAYWSDDMHWYGPAGIGTKPSLKAFQEEHQKPFLHAFPDKDANDEIRIAEGDYVAAKGYQQVTHGGDYLGIPATGKDMQIKYMDFWRAEEREGELKLVENWVMIDLLDFLEQAGYNVEKVLKYIGSKPPEYFDNVK